MCFILNLAPYTDATIVFIGNLLITEDKFSKTHWSQIHATK